MPSWVSIWLSWSTIGASGAVGAGLLVATAEDLLHGAGATTVALAMGFGGLGFCALALGLLMRGASDHAL